jgi:hypothetical protein
MGWDGIIVLTLAALASSFAACMGIRLAMAEGHLPRLEKMCSKVGNSMRPPPPKKK